jgi:hypothetical protein
MISYCPNCGESHDCTAPGRESVASDAVRIAEIERDKEIALAKIGARSSREMDEHYETVAGIEADATVAAAVAEAEVVGAAIEAGIQPQPEPMIIDAPTAISEDDTEDAPPEVGEGSQPPAPKAKSSGIGFW